MDKYGPFWRVFRKPEACGQIVLPDMSVLIGQKLVENAKIKYSLQQSKDDFIMTLTNEEYFELLELNFFAYLYCS